jgi:3-oxoacyl-[acyl-carrier protein] reductase
MFDLTGKTALVTGATGGIGGSIARALHAQGAHVVLSGTREAALEALAAELGGRTSAVTANLSDSASVDGLVAAAEAAAGLPLDILVANAGITRDGLMLRMKDEDWEQVIKVNLESYFRLSRAALRGHDEAPLGPDHRNHLGRRGHRKSRSGQLRRLQGRHDRLFQGPGPGSGQP